MTSRSCSWCHEMVPLSCNNCPGCGHEAHLPRISCCCAKCCPCEDTMPDDNEPDPLELAEQTIAEWERQDREAAPEDYFRGLTHDEQQEALARDSAYRAARPIPFNG